MATLLIKVWNVYLHREDGDFAEQTQVDEKSEELAKNLFYEDFDIPPQEGDYFEWEEASEKVDLKDYVSAGLSNEILKVLDNEREERCFTAVPPNATWMDIVAEPKKEVEGNVVTCEKDEADFFGVYAKIQEPNGLILPHWLADLSSETEAEEFVTFVKALKQIV